MFGKAYASMYTGSMLGAGMHIFAVWGYILANCNRDGSVEINPRLAAVQLGGTDEMVDQALAYLCAPDPTSRSPDEEGRRLVSEGPFLYRVVNYLQYRKIRDADERREYLRIKQQESRARRAGGSVDGQQPSTMSTHVEGEAEAEGDTPKTLSSNLPAIRETGTWVAQAIAAAGVEDFSEQRLLWEGRTLFSFWQYRSGKNDKVVIFTSDRKARATRWLKIYGLGDCLYAIEGAFHHPDHNPSDGRQFRDFENIFKARDGAGTIEKLRDAGQRSPKKVRAILAKLEGKGWTPRSG